jgi:hypothetical protein
VTCGLLLVARVAAGEGRDSRPVVARPNAKPTVTGNLLVPVRQQLTMGFFLAQSRLRTHPTCAALFSRLGADGLAILEQARYDGANFDRLSQSCRHGVPAFTKVGSDLVKLCPGFGVLSVPAAALTVIHEALHSAGLSEKPVDPKALTPQEINRMVQVSCGL